VRMFVHVCACCSQHVLLLRLVAGLWPLFLSMQRHPLRLNGNDMHQTVRPSEGLYVSFDLCSVAVSIVVLAVAGFLGCQTIQLNILTLYISLRLSDFVSCYICQFLLHLFPKHLRCTSDQSRFSTATAGLRLPRPQIPPQHPRLGNTKTTSWHVMMAGV
jgi:hypothetical protein